MVLDNRLISRCSLLARTWREQKRKLSRRIDRAGDRPIERVVLYFSNTEDWMNPGVVDELCDRARKTIHRDPAQALDWASLAVVAASEYHGPSRADWNARSHGELSNSLRVNQDLIGSEKAMAEAKRWFSRGSWDPLLRAELLSLEASLCRVRTDWGRQLVCLRKAIKIFSRLGYPADLARCQIQLATTWRLEGRYEEALELYSEARLALDGLDEPILEFCIDQGLVIALAKVGFYKEAEEAFLSAVDRADILGGEGVRGRLFWERGLLLMEHGEMIEALGSLERARAIFAACGRASEEAFVMLDEAAVCLRAGFVRRAAILFPALDQKFEGLGLGLADAEARTALREASTLLEQLEALAALSRLQVR